MRATFVFVLLSAFLLSLTFAQTCDLSIYAGASGWWGEFEFRAEPIEYDGDSQVCGDYFENGALQCCDDTVYNAIENAWDAARENINDAQVTMREAVDAWKIARDAFKDNIGTIRTALNSVTTLTDEQKDAIIELYEKTVEAYNRFLDRAVNYWANCLVGVLKYYVGIACLGCDPESSRYIDDSGLTLTIKLSEETCDEMVDACLPIWDALRDLFYEILNAQISYSNAVTGTSFDVVVSICDNGECADWICDNFYAGLTVQITGIPLPSSVGRSTPQTATVADHMNNLKEHENKLMELVNDKQASELVAKMLSAGREATHNVMKAFDVLNKNKDAQSTEGRRAASGNAYVSDGYSPFDVAAKSSLNTNVEDADDAAATLSSWTGLML